MKNFYIPRKHLSYFMIPRSLIPYNNTYQILIFQHYLTLILTVSPSTEFSLTNPIKKPFTRFTFSHLSLIPKEINFVSLHKRKYLLPIYLYCVLERNLNSNRYSKYRSLTKTMGYFHNIRAYALYFRILGAILELNSNLDSNSTNNLTDQSIQDLILQ